MKIRLRWIHTIAIPHPVAVGKTTIYSIALEWGGRRLWERHDDEPWRAVPMPEEDDAGVPSD